MTYLLNKLQKIPINQTQELEEWCKTMQQTLPDLDKLQKIYCLLALSDVYVARLGDYVKSERCLKQIGVIESEPMQTELKLRNIYISFLKGDYSNANEEFDAINKKCANNDQIRKIVVDFVKRILSRQQVAAGSIIRGSKQHFEREYIKALQYEKQNKFSQAKNIHKSLFNWSAQLPNSQLLEYEAAKHIKRLNELDGGKTDNFQVYQNVIDQFQKQIKNKNKYNSKVQFLLELLVFLDNNSDESREAHIDYGKVKEYVLQNISRVLSQTKNYKYKKMLEVLYISLEKDDPNNNEICYKFLGPKVYEELVENEKRQAKIKNKYKSKLLPKVKESNLKSKLEDRPIQENPKIPKQNIRQTFSQMVEQYDKGEEQQFQGSVMTKINMNSNGYEDRYFYIKSDFKANQKLYYHSINDKSSDNDDYYRLKGLKKIILGKQTNAFQRSQCDRFENDKCFTLKIAGDQDYERNFYVKNKKDYKSWIAVFQEIVHKKGQVLTKQTKLYI